MTIRFEPPAPGEWMLDTTHHGRRPVTRFAQHTAYSTFESGMAAMLARYGLPLETVQCRYVNGCMYVRPKAVGERRPGPPPPAPVLKLVSRVHPELRRRRKVAADAWATRRWRDDVDEWFERDREPTIERLIALQSVDLSELDDAELGDHLDDVVVAIDDLSFRGMATHGGDIIPTGDFLAHCEQWGLDTAAAAALLRGSSPATSEVARILSPVAAAIDATSERPETVEEVRALGPQVAAAVDRWLELHGWRTIDSDDIDAVTLAERPDLQIAALRTSGNLAADVETPDAAALREAVPADQRALFDELLAEARYGLRLRDDNVGVRWNWPMGLGRRALLEVGRRLEGRDRLDEVHHALELSPAEVRPLLIDGTGPTAAEVADRHRWRHAVESAGPPTTLGDPEGPPPVDAFPRELARATRAILGMIGAMEGVPATAPLQGVGVGERAYKGRACVATSVDDAFARLNDGDVLVAAFTGPAYNSIVGIVGAIVVEEGGPLCHAAIVARELGVPAVVGVTGASSDIPDGATVEVDPRTGTIRVS